MLRAAGQLGISRCRSWGLPGRTVYAERVHAADARKAAAESARLASEQAVLMENGHDSATATQSEGELCDMLVLTADLVGAQVTRILTPFRCKEGLSDQRACHAA